MISLLAACQNLTRDCYLLRLQELRLAPGNVIPLDRLFMPLPDELLPLPDEELLADTLLGTAWGMFFRPSGVLGAVM